jgi:uncharacterized LabA/DUF88 family protein
MRTYLYVDGENFTIRAQALDADLKADTTKAAATRRIVADWVGDIPNWDVYTAPSVWTPEPHNEVLFDRTRTRNGILFTRDEVYWDPVGLYLACGSSLFRDRGQHQVSVDRAYYFTGAHGGNIERHTRDLHAMGFTPNVSVRVKPDSFAQEMAEQGITVVSRPKPVDILIATRVLEDCVADNFDLCVFVGGDEDYVPLLEAVRRRGKQVWLVALEKSLSKKSHLRFTCDRFIPYDPVVGFRPLP